ncbi:hypothetical protein AVEN_160357-1 [Araneus ventricosus]|uniref:Uncharacterized protein n=1 Tax=Araneus ventricosus TaxID=182803 RepID=A0A4Y2FYC1_ARAVE|nr:hypothetical protein AVEN_160357-1 [Araneus ventricosus]
MADAFVLVRCWPRAGQQAWRIWSRETLEDPPGAEVPQPAGDRKTTDSSVWSRYVSGHQTSQLDSVDSATPRNGSSSPCRRKNALLCRLNCAFSIDLKLLFGSNCPNFAVLNLSSPLCFVSAALI